MARNKHATALFEVIQKSKGQEPSGAIRTPSWWFKRSAAPTAPPATDAAPAAQAPPPAADPITPAVEPPAAPYPPAAPAPADPVGHDAGTALIVDRQGRTVSISLSFQAAAITGGVLLLVLAVAYLGGRQFAGGPASASAGPTTEQLRQGPANPDVLNARTAAPAPVPPPAPATSSRQSTTTSPSQPAAPQPLIVRDVNRQIGLNYVIIQSYPREDLARDAVQVLAENGIGATIEQGLRGFTPSWYSVVGIDGFDRPALRSAEYQAYEQRIRDISAQHVGRRSFRAFEPMGYRWDR